MIVTDQVGVLLHGTVVVNNIGLATHTCIILLPSLASQQEGYFH